MDDSQTLQSLFEPHVVAVVGASAAPEKRGHQIVRALLDSGFDGDVIPVNPKGGSILGLDVAPSIATTDPCPDLAVLALPATAVPEAVEEAASRGIPVVVVLAVGFAESGPAGAAREERLGEIAERTGIRIVGPNTSGVINAHCGLNVIGTPGVSAGPVSVVTQSGNLALHLVRAFTSAGSGISICLGVGNQVDVGFAEALNFLKSHEPTRAIVVYAEGFANGAEFIQACARTTPTRPVVVLKSGRTAAGRQAALSHTGAIAGPYDVLVSALQQVGATVVAREDELTPVTLAVANQPANAGGVAVLSDGGGQGTLASDALFEAGVRLASLSDASRTALRTLLGPAAALQNPVDIAGRADSDPEIFGQTAQILLSDDDVGSVMVVGLFGGYHLRFAASLLEGESAAARAMAVAGADAGKGMIVHTMYAHEPSPPLSRLREANVPVIGSLEAACAAVGALQRRGIDLAGAPHPVASRRSVPERRGGHAAGRSSLSEWEARSFLESIPALDVPFVEATRCTNEFDVERAADHYAVVALKADVEGVVHKTELGGVVLGVHHAQARSEAVKMFARMPAAARPNFILVQPMLAPPLAELILAARYDRHVGVVATVGAGGVWTEALGDVAHVLLPCRPGAIVDATRSLKIAARLSGARGGDRAANATLESIEALAVRLGDCVAAHQDVVEIELNPLFVYPDRVVAADALVVRID